MERPVFAALQVAAPTLLPAAPSLSLAQRRKPLPKLNLCLAKPVTAGTVGSSKVTLCGEIGVSNGESEGIGQTQALPGRFADEFELGGVLGSGTVAVVRLAIKRSDGRQVAVKRVRSTDDEVRQFTRDEFELVRTLNHPAIIKFDALYESTLNIWICMEFCSDGCVDSYMRAHGTFDEVAVRLLGSQMMRGVNYLHHKRVVHRDLKPANMLLQKCATILKIGDFNSAKRIGKSLDGSVMLTDRGTCQYSAPELRFGLIWNERVDIWSCGLCLYFMFRRQLPFSNQDPGVKETLSLQTLPNINWGNIADSMRHLIQKCLIVNMHDRPLAMELLLHPVFRVSSSANPNYHRTRTGTEELNNCIVDRETPKKRNFGDIFVFKAAPGLLALHAGRQNVSGTPPTDASKSNHWSSGRATMYLLTPATETPDAERSPREELWDASYSRWKEPRRFDALLHLAESKFGAD